MKDHQCAGNRRGGQADPPAGGRKPKIGIFIVTFNASATIAQVLSRITPETWDQISEVFVFDDSSQDSTCKEVVQFKIRQYADKIKIFRNQVNLGYGGNQKRGYQYAIREGFDFVVLLHGDGQYAPEVLGDIIAPVAGGDAEAVFGSRMLEKGAARRGGMPLYKFVGNKILSGFQNLMLGQNLSEYHSGYRAYHVPSLAKIPFLKNSNDFHFDTEIILQLLAAGCRIKEVPIPTYYGDEICHVNGLKYAWNVVKATTRYCLHRAGLIGHQEQFVMESATKYQYKPNRFSSHNQIVNLLETSAAGKRLDVLDIGCGSGFLAEKLAAQGHRVTGVDVYDSPEARQVCREFHATNVEEGLGLADTARFDCIIFADVLEHTRDPETILLRARQHLKPGGRVIASTGNVAHLYIRLGLLLGRFSYTERGILDRTHLRLFTCGTFRQLFAHCSFRVGRSRTCPIPFENLFPGWPRFASALSWLNMAVARWWPALFGYQTVVEAFPETQPSSELLRADQINAPYTEWEQAA